MADSEVRQKLRSCKKCGSPSPWQPYYLLKCGVPTPETIYTTDNSIKCDSFWHLGGVLGKTKNFEDLRAQMSPEVLAQSRKRADQYREEMVQLMDYARCINCRHKVTGYDKYCYMCLRDHPQLKQDHDYWRHPARSWEQSQELAKKEIAAVDEEDRRG